MTGYLGRVKYTSSWIQNSPQPCCCIQKGKLLTSLTGFPQEGCRWKMTLLINHDRFYPSTPLRQQIHLCVYSPSFFERGKAIDPQTKGTVTSLLQTESLLTDIQYLQNIQALNSYKLYPVFVNLSVKHYMESSRSVQSNIKVYSRFRPLSSKEILTSAKPTHLKTHNNRVTVKGLKEGDTLSFVFDEVLDVDATQRDVYQVAAYPVVRGIFLGFNGTIFAYGQTASGKTYTMYGPPSLHHRQSRGIIPRAIEHIFEEIHLSPSNLRFSIKASIVELYLEKVRDLLDYSKTDLKIRSQPKKGIYVENVTQEFVESAAELSKLVESAHEQRVTATTKQNQRSSRSHLIVIITVEQTDLETNDWKSGKLYMVDLAGSEKAGRVGVDSKSIQETNKINTSLTILGKVIKALSESKTQHIPYRQSKLTRILQQSVGGNSQTTMIVTCSPHISNLSQTLSSLRFGIFTRKIKNRPTANREMSVGEMQNMLQKFQIESMQKSRKIQILESLIRRELGDIPELMIPCSILTDSNKRNNPVYPDSALQSPCRSESSKGSHSQYQLQNSFDGSLSDRRSNYEQQLSSVSRQRSQMEEQARQYQIEMMAKKLHRAPILKTSNSNVMQNQPPLQYSSKPLTQRTPRWSDLEGPQLKTAQKLESGSSNTFDPNIFDQINIYTDHTKEQEGCKQQTAWNIIPISSKQNSFMAVDAERTPPSNEGFQCLPTSRDYRVEPTTDFTVEDTNNTIEQLECENVESPTYEQLSQEFRKQLQQKSKQIERFFLKVEARRSLREDIKRRMAIRKAQNQRMNIECN